MSEEGQEDGQEYNNNEEGELNPPSMNLD